jgi:squalene-hopene/tetraprenyl-beta-curcumene cyclase
MRRSPLFLCLSGLLAAASPTGGGADASWNPRAAAAYLDRRIDWWMTWPGASRDHDTFCVSCHTAVAYSLARPTLHSTLRETAPSPSELRCLDNVTKRVRLWTEVKPFYGGRNSAPSRGTEAVLNALILASRDARSGDLSDDARSAFSNMWALQLTSGNARGAWEWIQFDNEPWEAHDSQYYGAAMAALAVGAAPGNYRATPEVQGRLQQLREYLNREFAKQSPVNQAVVLWASGNWPGLLTSEQRSVLINDLFSKQQADGGWSLASLVWTWRDWSFTSLAKLWAHSEATPLNPKSDGYATGLIALALEQSGISPDDLHVQRARFWLVRNQSKVDGRWPAYSPNGKRDHSYGEGLFMNDAATAYAVLALTAR